MKLPSIFKPKRGRALTFIELLIIVVIGAILFAMLMPINPHGRSHPQSERARMEVAMLFAAIQSYHSAYGRYPVSSNIEMTASIANEDFT